MTLLADAADIGSVERVTLLADIVDTELAEWAMRHGMGHKLVVVAVQEKLLCCSAGVEREVRARRHEAVDVGTVMVERENGRVCVSRDVKVELGRLLGLRVFSWKVVVGIRRADSRALLSRGRMAADFRYSPETGASWMSMATSS